MNEASIYTAPAVQFLPPSQRDVRSGVLSPSCGTRVLHLRDWRRPNGLNPLAAHTPSQ